MSTADPAIMVSSPTSSSNQSPGAHVKHLARRSSNDVSNSPVRPNQKDTPTSPIVPDTSLPIPPKPVPPTSPIAVSDLPTRPNLPAKTNHPADPSPVASPRVIPGGPGGYGGRTTIEKLKAMVSPPVSPRKGSTTSNSGSGISNSQRRPESQHRDREKEKEKEKERDKDKEKEKDKKGNKIVRLGHYIFGRTLGQGTFGKVKLAEHELTGHQVAVKILNRDKLLAQNMDKKISREIKILKLLRHPHVIRLYEVVETPTDIILVMEYLKGGELFQYIIDHWPLSEDTVRRFFQQIICAVEHIHYFRVVHRDLKPENVLVDNDENIKLADFGLSNMMSDGDFLRTSCGSPNYAAPEVVAGRLYAGPEVDVWGVGVILYAMLCGRLPFDDENLAVLFKKIQQGRYSVPLQVPRQAVDLLSRLLVVDQLKRVTIPQIRQHEWFLKNLPPYLALSPEQQESDEEFDQELIAYVVRKTGIPEDICCKVLKFGIKSDISTAYYALLDGKLRAAKRRQFKEDLVNRQISSLQSTTEISALDTSEDVERISPPPQPPVEAAPPKPAGAVPDVAVECQKKLKGKVSSQKETLQSARMIETLVVGNRSLEKITRQRYNQPFTPAWRLLLLHRLLTSIDSAIFRPPVTSPLTSPQSLPKFAKESTILDAGPSHKNWRLGVFTQLKSTAAMTKIYAVLKRLRYRWKVVNPFQLHCRKGTGTPDLVCVSVYRVCVGDVAFLIDLSLLSEETLSALNAIHSLYIHLAKCGL